MRCRAVAPLTCYAGWSQIRSRRRVCTAVAEDRREPVARYTNRTGGARTEHRYAEDEGPDAICWRALAPAPLARNPFPARACVGVCVRARARVTLSRALRAEHLLIHGCPVQNDGAPAPQNNLPMGTAGGPAPEWITGALQSGQHIGSFGGHQRRFVSSTGAMHGAWCQDLRATK